MSRSGSFTVGTNVRLTCGGPDMSVKEYSDRLDYYVCQWFAGKKLEQGIFKHEQLVVVQENQKSA